MPSRLRLRRPDRQLPFSASCFTNPLHNQESLVQHAASLPGKVVISLAAGSFGSAPVRPRGHCMYLIWRQNCEQSHHHHLSDFTGHKRVGSSHPTNANIQPERSGARLKHNCIPTRNSKKSKVTPFPPPPHLLQHNVLFFMPLFFFLG